MIGLCIANRCRLRLGDGIGSAADQPARTVETPRPVRAIETADLNVLAGTWRVDELAIANVNPHMRESPTQGIKKDEISGA